ncbi:MAG: hypothetical protein Q7R35_16325 [Elusimicrobiota bacterium]|nr:hypothetical protein [Elusimicrobiota bacterium]
MELFKAHPVLVFAAVIAAVTGLVFYLSWKRRKDLEQLASSLGLALSPDGPDVNTLENTGLEIFRLGYSRKAANLIQLQCRAGVISVFDYRYVTRGGKNSHSHNFTLALIDCSGCAIPEFELKPESFIYKIGEAIGFKDIDLPAFPLFSDKYRLTGSDEASVHMFFTPQRAAWFERNLGLRVQGAPGHIVISSRDGQLPVNSWPTFIEEVKAFAAEVLR